jgi:branched-chain amino acid transport system substrate-binding protein
VTVAASGVVLALGLTACGGGGGGNGPGAQPIALVIGNSLPLSGISKRLGESGEKASRLALTQIDRAIREDGSGHTVRLAAADQGATSDTAVAAARGLVDDRNANCLTGPWSAEAVSRAAQDVAIPAKVLEISPVPTAADLTDLNDHDLVDSTALPASLEGSALSDAIERDLGTVEGQAVNVAAGTDPYGDTISQSFIRSWQDRDGSIGAGIDLGAPPVPDSNPAEELSGGSPDATLLIDDAGGFVGLAPSLAATPGWDPPRAWGSDQLVSPGLPGRVPARALAGMRALAPGIPAAAAPSTAFVRDFGTATPRSVTLQPFAAQEFDATILCYLAAVAAGSTDGQEMADELIDITAPGGTDYSWEQLPEAVKALEDGKDIDYTGASGALDMDVHGNPTGGVFDVYRYSPTGLERVDQVSISQPNPATP